MNGLKKLLPETLINFLRTPYHFILAFFGGVVFRFPSRKIKVVAVTGTKGKSTVTELVNAILEEAGFRTALSNTLKFKIGDQEERNLYKMTMPGRFFVQKFLRKALSTNCDWAIIEMTSEGAKQFRHKFIELDALIFTNISPEHIESHGSYEKYLEAKLSIARTLSSSKKKEKILIVNEDDKEAEKFLKITNVKKITYGLSKVKDISLEEGFSIFKVDDIEIKTSLVGMFNIYNILAAISFAKNQAIPEETIKKAIEKIEKIRGRVEEVESGEPFKVIVDYAHTPDSLEKLYKAFGPFDSAQDEHTNQHRLICVLGNTGGGRDRWKRPEMGRIANEHCDKIILTNEDPYDEDPKKIIDEMAVSVSPLKLKIKLDRREAIREAIKTAREEPDKENVIVLISGKGTDPFIMGPRGSKIPWDDAEVVREELKK